MASLGKAIASGITNVFEVAPSLLHLNFNFALHQVEAPVEFEGVGKALSSIRRTNAEEGQSHVTARILGALFVSLTPKTPKLFSAYGLRASEISQSAQINPLQIKQYGFFSSHAGADATTIWASATSGPGAIAVHLLACMLARIWDPSDAISIWTEIVKQRRESILNDLAEGGMVDLRDAAAARNTLSRQQLADWDASARAWLYAADRVKTKEQKQLMLILDNIHDRVNTAQEAFHSVLRAWLDSLSAFEALLNGVSQKARNGGILLALSAWHIYPDLMIVEPYPKTIAQRDSLLSSSGILTVGLQNTQGEQGGICWSLPLAQLRHYGPPVNRERTLNSTQRLTVDEFSQVFLGAYLHGWGDTGTETINMIQWLHKVGDASARWLKCDGRSPEVDRLSHPWASWFDILLDASEMCLQALAKGDESFKQLLRLGRRYAEGFLGQERGQPYFGLSTRGTFVSCTKSEEDRVQILRDAAANLPGRPSQMFIRIRHEMMSGANSIYEYATAKPLARSSSKRQVDGSHRPAFVHQRWMHGGTDFQIPTNDTRYFRRLVKQFPELNQPQSPFTSHDVVPQFERTDIISRCLTFMDYHNSEKRLTPLQIIQDHFEERSKIYQGRGEDVYSYEQSAIEDFRVKEMGIFWPTYAADGLEANPWYEMIYGDDDTALFADSDEPAIRARIESLSSDQFHTFFSSSLWAPDKLLRYVSARISAYETSNYWKSLRAISYAGHLYRGLKIATIDVRVLEHALWKSPWLPKMNMVWERMNRDKLPMPGEVDLMFANLWVPQPTDLSKVFSCICFFDSGRFQIPPKNLSNVMAMCSNDLIWVASSLLNDPSSEYLLNERSQIRVFPGNIGRSGIAFMVPPADPMKRPRNIHSFRDIVHRPFEGHLQNNFGTTSLHLSFTTAEIPLTDKFSGLKDDELYLLETLLSVHEGGRWVADLDVQGSLSSPRYRRLLGKCEHSENSIAITQAVSCIDSWAELLEPPETQFSIVRACGDWQARLATFSVAVSAEKDIIILPDTLCWQCTFNKILDHKLRRKIILIA